MATKKEVYRNLQKFQTCPACITFICVRCGMVLSVVPLCSSNLILLQCSECGINQLHVSIYDNSMLELIAPIDLHEFNCKNLNNWFCRALGETKTRCVYMDTGGM